MSAQRQQLEAAIQALQAQRPVLGDAVVDLALAPLQARLAALGEAEAPPPPVPRPEPAQVLRQVSILFMDVVGSTTLAQRLDPEEVSAVMDDALARGSAIVRQHHGKVLQYAGDNILAAFGADAAHEDDAERAVHCGLALLRLGQALGQAVLAAHGHAGFDVRVGVHTGGVLLGGGVDAEGTIRGSAVNLAARMEQTALPGSLRISHDTYVQVRGRFEVEPQAPLQVKGVEQPVTSWLVRGPSRQQGLQAWGAERGIEGLPVPMIGRAAEREALLTAVRASAGGRLAAITLVAAAGLGKSRLLREVLAELLADPQVNPQLNLQVNLQAGGARVLMVRANPGAALRPWGLLHGLLCSHCGIADGDSAAQARERLLARLAPRLGADGEAAAQRIGQLLGLDFGDVPALRGLDARALRDLALAALLRWLDSLGREAAGQPVVLVFEDLHWADDASLGALAAWFEQAAHLPLALLMSTRPTLLERRPAWGEAGPACRRIVLQPLAADQRDAMAQALLRRIDAPPPALRALLVDRAEGNPYYMEELLRHLLDSGAIQRQGERWQVDEPRLGHLRLPTTLVGLLQARLDALPTAERRSAQRASIVGHVFWDEALAQIDPEAPTLLGALQQRQWVQPRATSAFHHTPERQFDHHLLHQVTYDTLLKDERRRGHAAVAHWLSRRTAGRAPEFLAVTAEHAERAGDTDMATRCYSEAAAEAALRFANALAVDCLRKALRLLPQDSDQRLPMLNRLRQLLDRIGDQPAVQQVIDEQMAWLAVHPDPVQEASVLADQALLHDRLGQLDQARELALKAAALAETCGAHDTGSFAHAELCWLEHMRGHPEAAQAHLDAARALALRVRDTVPLREVQALQLAGILAGQQGRHRQAVALLHESMLRAIEAGQPRAQAASLEHMAGQLVELQDYPAALAQASQALALARAIGDRRAEDAALGVTAQALCQMGRSQPAAQAAREAMAVARALHNRPGLSGYLLTLGKALSELGDAAGAWQAFDEAWQWRHTALPGSAQAHAALALRSAQDLALGRPAQAREGVASLTAALGDDLGAWSPIDSEALEGQHACWQVLSALADPRAAPLGHALVQRARDRAQALAEEGRSAEAILHDSRAMRLCMQPLFENQPHATR